MRLSHTVCLAAWGALMGCRGYQADLLRPLISATFDARQSVQRQAPVPICSCAPGNPWSFGRPGMGDFRQMLLHIYANTAVYTQQDVQYVTYVQCMYVCESTRVRVSSIVHVHVYICMCIQMHLCNMCIYIYISKNTYLCMYTLVWVCPCTRCVIFWLSTLPC